MPFSIPDAPSCEQIFPMDTQATVSTANTGSLTPVGGSSSAEGRGGGDGPRAPPALEPLTRASAACCSPQVIRFDF